MFWILAVQLAQLAWQISGIACQTGSAVLPARSLLRPKAYCIMCEIHIIHTHILHTYENTNENVIDVLFVTHSSLCCRCCLSCLSCLSCLYCLSCLSCLSYLFLSFFLVFLISFFLSFRLSFLFLSLARSIALSRCAGSARQPAQYI